MYRFRTTFELSYFQMVQYVRLYAKRVDIPIRITMGSIGVVLLAIAVYFAITQKWFETAFFILMSVCSVISMFILTIVHQELLLRKLPFAIGSHITMELQDGFFHVNCSGQMKSYSKGDLTRVILTNGDYILWKKKNRLFQTRDIIVIPAEKLTELMRSEIEQFLV